jgi:hypothetical protein
MNDKTEKEIKTKIFQGKNRTRLEANIQEFIEEIGGKRNFISTVWKSTYPEYVFEVSYYAN